MTNIQVDPKNSYHSKLYSTETGAMSFPDKLNIWHPLINALSPNGFGRYSQAMQSLVAGILQKIQIRVDAEIKTLDNNQADEEVRSLEQSKVE